jgi:hypothetical protein
VPIGLGRFVQLARRELDSCHNDYPELHYVEVKHQKFRYPIWENTQPDFQTNRSLYFRLFELISLYLQLEIGY